MLSDALLVLSLFTAWRYAGVLSAQGSKI